MNNSVIPSRNVRKPKPVSKSAVVFLRNFDVPLVSGAAGSPLDSISLEPDRPYTIGRTSCRRRCDFRFHDRRVSKRHCQVLFDSVDRKIYILDGTILLCGEGICVVSEFRKRLLCDDDEESVECSRVRVSLNGVFVNGIRVRKGAARELCAGDEVLLACGNEDTSHLGVRIGFVIQGIVFKEEVVVEPKEVQLERPRLFEGTASSFMGQSQGSVSSGNQNKRVFAVRADEIMPLGCASAKRKCGGIGRAKFLLGQCRHILHSNDPVSYIRKCAFSDCGTEIRYPCYNKLNRFDANEFPLEGETGASQGLLISRREGQPCDNLHTGQDTQNDRNKDEVECIPGGGDGLHKKDIVSTQSESPVADDNLKTSPCKSVGEENPPHGGIDQMKTWSNYLPPPGMKLYLNRLHFMEHNSSSHENVVSLPELLFPTKTIEQIFIATFTSDILWFLSYCEIPCHLPVTIACHNTERCWSSSPDKRSSRPYEEFPNLVLVFPPFPEAIAFGKDLKRKGVGCHHPKLFVLQRGDSIRVIITSANLVANQWLNVTNTVWWQDFPSRSSPDLLSLFNRGSIGETTQNSRSDFAAQLAGFMASLLIDVPGQSHWIIELAKYNFEGAVGHLIVSVPGIYSCRTPCKDYDCTLESFGVKFVGSVEASVVGLSHLFCTVADRNGALLKKLASFLQKSREDGHGLSGIVLRRNTNVPVDENAVSVLVPNPDQFAEEDCVQLGFLPRNLVKWISPLWDSGFFRFSGYVYPKETLAAALGGGNMRVQLILHVSQGPSFPDMMRMMQPEHVVAFCSLIASLQRCTGLWRLQEVLDRHKWPELEQSDFIYSASSIGSSVNAQFLAAFAAASGKRSLQRFDSQESDPEWGCWSTSQERKNPSIRIAFPTIERVKDAHNGILPSRRILCFSEKTWQRLRSVEILHDAIPHPRGRVGQPMHIKVARRRFWSKTDASSCGWIYCGSHNFSAAAWGRPLSDLADPKLNETKKTNSPLGSRLHVCNYELGIVFLVPPMEMRGITSKDCADLDDIVLPFVVPAPKYGPRDRPATAQTMRQVLAELTEEERGNYLEVGSNKEMVEEIPDDEEEVVEPPDLVVEEKEEEKAYAEMLWNQVDGLLQSR